MRKSYTLPILLILLAFAYFMFLSSYKNLFYDEPLYGWFQVGGIGFLLYVILSLFLRKKYRLLIWIPGFLFVGFIAATLIYSSQDPLSRDPLSHYSLIYASLIVYFLIVLVDGLNTKYAQIKLFFTTVFLPLMVYGFLNFYYLISSSGINLPEHEMELFLMFIIYTSPYLVLLINAIYQAMTKEELIKEEVPYNRYRPEQNDQKISLEKTSAQLQREKNAIRGLSLLHDAGLLSDDEFERKKTKILSGK